MSQTLLSYGLGVFALGALVFALYPYLTGSIKAEKRRKALQAVGPRRGAERVPDGAARRRQVAESLKEADKRGKRRHKTTLAGRIGQAGLTFCTKAFYLGSALGGLALGGLAFVLAGSPLIALAAAGIGGLGLPNWWLNFLGKRRITKFINEFPNAIDVIVRGIRAGLPLADCLRVIATESAEPVRSEFRLIIEAQAIGLGLGEAVERIVERVPIPEANFFAIVIGIQQKAGGNLSEALSNLSRVLRDRKKMRNKVKAVSSEANASAMIIGSMPFAVGTLIYIVSPTYVELLWTTSTGRMMMAIAAFWMTLGVVVMKKMISFDI
jgi:tight adherence protein B